MKVYSDFRAQRSRQILADILACVAIGAWVWLGTFVYGLIMGLRAFGVQMQDSGAGFRQTMADISANLGGIPLIGGGVQAPFDAASDAGAALEAAGVGQQLAVQQLATGLGVGIAVLPVLTILVLWLAPRVLFARRANAVAAHVQSGTSLDLLALRAMSTQSLAALARVHSDPLGQWRQGNPVVIRELAQLESKSSGVRLE
ncbi:MAG: hypothetical protein ACOH1J_03125 [Microbacteriaceae bacterium]